jgi:endonuclease/exonuclease/phosphatase family metal-dependent hydrolase
MQGKHIIPISLVLFVVLLLLTITLNYLLSYSGLEEAVKSALDAQGVPPGSPATSQPVVVAGPAPAEPEPSLDSGPPPASMWKASSRVFLDPVFDNPAVGVVPGERIRVCSYNIENFADGYHDGPKRTTERQRRQAFFASEIIRKIEPDILMIQEIENARSLLWLNEYCGDTFSVGYITGFERSGQSVKLNLAVLSRLPIEQAVEIDFGELKFQNAPPRGLLRFTVALDDTRRFLCYVTHLKSNWGSAEKNQVKRRRGIEILQEDAERFVSDRTSHEWEIMIAGDMNVDPENERFLSDPSLDPLSDYVDLWRGRPISDRTTIPTRRGDPEFMFPPAAFDRVLVNSELIQNPWKITPLIALQEGVDTDDRHAEPGNSRRHVSDHYPVFADIMRN